MDWQQVHDNYDVNQDLVWLNNCGIVPAGRHIVSAVSDYLQGYARKGVLTEVVKKSEVQRKIKNILANLLRCDPEELALIHNTAEGMNYISHGLNLRPGDEIILLENEYPSNYYPWQHWLEKGVKLRTTPMADSPDRFFDKLVPLINSRTRVISLSTVHWCTGMPLPLEAVGVMCREKKIDFVVDGAQGVGMQPVDVKAAHISYMAFPAWKWLMGPLGVGVLYVPRRNLEELKPVFIGTASVVDDEQYLPYKTTLKPTADRFTISTANFCDWVYFLAALEFIERIGFENVRHRLFELSRHFSDALRNIGFEPFGDRFPDHPTAIIACEHSDIPAGRVLQHLKRSGIVAAERIGRIRFSPHIYIVPEQIDRVIRVLGRLE